MGGPAHPLGPPLPPPGLRAPAPFEVSFGRVAGVAPLGARRIAVRVDGRLVALRRLAGRSFDFRVAMPMAEVEVSVQALAPRRRPGRPAVVRNVLGLPTAARPEARAPWLDCRLARRLLPLARTFPGTSALYVQDLTTGAGAAWNARARFPAASTLKVAIAVAVLRSLAEKPERGSAVDRLLRAMLERSDNAAANALEIMLAGSTSAGGARVTALMRALGMSDSLMYGGYQRSPQGRAPIPARVDAQPPLAPGKYTSAHDLARLFAVVHLAAEGKGPLGGSVGRGLTPSDARYLLYLLAHAADRGKIDRFLGRRAIVAHKAGWLALARHDSGIVYWPGGALVVAVMTHGAGVGTASDVLAGRVALATLESLRQSQRDLPPSCPDKGEGRAQGARS